MGGDTNPSCGEGEHKSSIYSYSGRAGGDINLSITRVGGNRSPSYGEGKHKSSVVVEWQGGTRHKSI